MKNYTVTDLMRITKKSKNTILRWINGQTKKGIKLQATRQWHEKSQPYLISEKDFKAFILKVNGLDY